MRINNEIAEFSSGITKAIECGIIGINNEFELSEGYDAKIRSNELSDCDKIELADYMINLWSTFRDSLTPNAQFSGPRPEPDSE